VHRRLGFNDGQPHATQEPHSGEIEPTGSEPRV
jgi:putative drug exporter of the RND superfamily